MALTQFPEPKSLNKLEIGNSKDDRTMVYSLENPHPLYGKDPNIINELGHTIYPKLIYPAGKDQPGIMVKNAKEEAEHLGKEPEDIKQENHAKELTEVEKLRAQLKEAEERLAAKFEGEAVEASTESKDHPWGE